MVQHIARVAFTHRAADLAQANIALFSVHVAGLVPSQGLEADVAECRAVWSLSVQQCAAMCDMDRTSGLLGKRKFEAM